LKKAIENSKILVTTLTKKEKTMTKTKDTTFFENKLLDFVTAHDPMLEMMQWMMNKEIRRRSSGEEFFRAPILT